MLLPGVAFGDRNPCPRRAAGRADRCAVAGAPRPAARLRRIVPHHLARHRRFAAADADAADDVETRPLHAVRQGEQLRFRRRPAGSHQRPARSPQDPLADPAGGEAGDGRAPAAADNAWDAASLPPLRCRRLRVKRILPAPKHCYRHPPSSGHRPAAMQTQAPPAPGLLRPHPGAAGVADAAGEAVGR